MRCLRAAAAALLLVIFNLPAGAQNAGISDVLPLAAVEAAGGPVYVAGAGVAIGGRAENVRAAGVAVELTAAVDRDAWLTGLSVLSDATIGGGLWALGGNVALRGRITGNMSLGGLAIRSEAQSGNVSLIGGIVSATPAAAVAAGDLVGATVNFSGRATGPLRLAGAVVLFNGQTTGSVSILAGRVIIGPRATIAGDLNILSGQPAEIDRASRVTGRVTQGLAIFGWMPPSWIWSLALAVLLAIGAFVTGLIGILLFGGIFDSATTLARWNTVPSLLYGVLAFFGLPLLALAMLMTVVGIPFGAVLLLALPLLLLAAHATAATMIASAVLMRRERPLGTWQSILFLALGLVLLSALTLLPTIGGWLFGIALLIGLGGFVRSLARRLRLGALEVP